MIRKPLIVCLIGLGIPALWALAGPAFADKLPLGDGMISTSPKAGYVFACQAHFSGGGAHRRGEWIGKDRWDRDAKPRVEGSIRWPGSSISVKREGALRAVRANNLPNHATGKFPVDPASKAYRYDRNPNSIEAQTIVLALPAEPHMAAKPSCVPMGMIGFALSGVAIYNALDAQGRDAPAHEIQDKCNGHPQRGGQYHYHDFSQCMGDRRRAPGGHSDLVGYALDGFGFYGPHGENGKELSAADLDACHGHAHAVTWDGSRKAMYHYHLTRDYPYTIGCFRGATAGAVKANTARERTRAQRRGGGNRAGRQAVLQDAAKTLGIEAAALRRALGPPPPDFEQAAKTLGVAAADLRNAMAAARRKHGFRPPPRP